MMIHDFRAPGQARRGGKPKRGRRLPGRPFVVHAAQGGVVTIAPSGTVARVSEVREDFGFVGDDILIPKTRISSGRVEGIPDRVMNGGQPSTLYLVSGMVLAGVGQRDDVLAPDTGAGAVRDESGRIIGTTGFVVRK